MSSHRYTPVEADIVHEGIRNRRDVEYMPHTSPDTLRMLAKYLQFFADTSCHPRGDLDAITATRCIYEQDFEEILDAEGTELITQIDIEVTVPKKTRCEQYPQGLVAAYSVWVSREDNHQAPLTSSEYRLRQFHDGSLGLSMLSSMDYAAGMFLPDQRLTLIDGGWHEATEYEASDLMRELQKLALPGQEMDETDNNKVV